MRAIKDYRVGTLTICDTNKIKRVVDGQKANLLAVKFVDTFKIEDLEIDLVDKEVYQLINKANNAEYSYNQVKDQRH